MYYKGLGIALVSLGISFSSFADHYSSAFSDKDWVLKTAEKLNLSDKQKQDIKKIAADTQKDSAKYRKKYLEYYVKINNEFKTNTFDNKKDQYVDKELKIIKELIHLRMQERLDVYQVLTPEQRKSFEELVDKWLQEHQNS
jgi:Spy/CpxP family protein refolding chaperone